MTRELPEAILRLLEGKPQDRPMDPTAYSPLLTAMGSVEGTHVVPDGSIGELLLLLGLRAEKEWWHMLGNLMDHLGEPQ